MGVFLHVDSIHDRFVLLLSQNSRYVYTNGLIRGMICAKFTVQNEIGIFTMK